MGFIGFYDGKSTPPPWAGVFEDEMHERSQRRFFLLDYDWIISHLEFFSAWQRRTSPRCDGVVCESNILRQCRDEEQPAMMMRGTFHVTRV